MDCTCLVYTDGLGNPTGKVLRNPWCPEHGTSLLADIRAQMEELLGEQARDIEADHTRADNLLIQALEWFSAREQSAQIRHLTALLIQDWRQLEKWYA